MSTTFWHIINNDKIEIPEIQRDYAQGRKNTRVDAIREAFVSDLLEALSSENKLNLDFVFGQAVDRTNQANFNKSKQNLEQMLEVLKIYSEETGVSFKSEVAPKPITSSKDKLIIPFDGQQRLTTLFLLHLFIGAKANKDISCLSRFSYKTRESSLLFIERLVNNSSLISSPPNDDDKELKGTDTESKKNISWHIKNQPWFFDSWKKDPTVSGMLVMLDEIEKQFITKNIDVNEAWINLVEKGCIEFDFFDIQEGGFDEDLYVKMNARGKALSDFENFRAWLEKEHKHSSPELEWSKLDKEWLDVFWKTKEEIADVDVNLMAFFKNMALFYHLPLWKHESDKTHYSEEDLIKLLKPNSFTPTSQYKKHGIFTEDSLTFIFKILDIVSDDEYSTLDDHVSAIWTPTFNNKENTSFTKQLLTGFDKLTRVHKTFFYATLRFLLVNDKPIGKYTVDDWVKLKNWLRVARNIIYNSRIDDNSTYISAIKSLSKLDDNYIINTYSELNKTPADNKAKWITFFNEKQQKEESFKVKKLYEGEDINKWRILIYEAENQVYFYGQIGFIFELAENDIYSFETYLYKLKNIFSEENIKSSEYILQCLFLAFDDTDNWLEELTVYRYMFYSSSVSNSRNRDENWRKLFNDSTKRDILKALLDSSTCESSDIQDIINKKKNELDKLEMLHDDKWKYYILDVPSMLDACQNAILSISSDTSNVRLLNRSNHSSIQWELRTFHFYKKQKEKKAEQLQQEIAPFSELFYFRGSGRNIIPCMVFHNWLYKGVEYFIDCKFDSNGYVLKLSWRNEGEIDSSIVEQLIQKHEFHEEGGWLVSPYVDYTDLESKISEVLGTLIEINNS